MDDTVPFLPWIKDLYASLHGRAGCYDLMNSGIREPTHLLEELLFDQKPELRHRLAKSNEWGHPALMEGLRQESTDGVVRTTSISPGFVDTQLDSSIDDVAVREQIRRTMNDFGLPPSAVARAIAFAVEQPHDTEIGDITIRPTVQG